VPDCWSLVCLSAGAFSLVWSGCLSAGAGACACLQGRSPGLLACCASWSFAAWVPGFFGSLVTVGAWLEACFFALG
jgi:hypothetical protein